MYDDARLADFDEGGVLEGVSDQAEVGLEQGEQVVVGNVAGGDHEEPAWQVLQQVAIAEVAVLCDYHAVLAVGDVRKLAVAGSIAVWQAGGMDTVVIGFILS